MMTYSKSLKAVLLIAAFALSMGAEARIKRSITERNAFQKEYPCPSTGAPKGKCPGYVVDHVKALACGGADKRYNMQWQTVQEAKAKDKWERLGCSRPLK